MSQFLGRIGRIFWDPIRIADTDPPAFVWLEQQIAGAGAGYVTPGAAWFRHGPENPVTQRLIALLRSHVKSLPRNDEAPLVIGLGSGAGNLEREVSRVLDIPILETDLTPPAAEPHRWRREDMTALSFSTGSKRVALASFALEYAGPKAFAEAARVLDPQRGVLVALVHHTGSSMYPSYWNPMTHIMNGLVHLGTAFPLWRWALPQGMRASLEMMYRLYHSLRAAAFRSQDELRQTLRRAGFQGEISIETAKAPPIWMPNSSARLDSGWIVVAKRR